MDFGVILTGAIGLITTIVTGWSSWFLTRKKYNSEVDKNLITNMQEALEFYKQLSDDNKNRLDAAIQRSLSMEKEVADMRKELTSLATSICYNLTCKLRQLEPQLKQLEDEQNKSGVSL